MQITQKYHANIRNFYRKSKYFYKINNNLLGTVRTGKAATNESLTCWSCICKQAILKYFLLIVSLAFFIASCSDDADIAGNTPQPPDTLLTSFGSFEIEFSNLHIPSQMSLSRKGELINQYSFDSNFYYGEKVLSDGKALNYVKEDTISIRNGYHSYGADKWRTLYDDSTREVHIIIDRVRKIVKRVSYRYSNFYKIEYTDGHGTPTTSADAIDSLIVTLHDMPYTTDSEGNLNIFLPSSHLRSDQIEASFYSVDGDWNSSSWGDTKSLSIGPAYFTLDGYFKLTLRK